MFRVLSGNYVVNGKIPSWVRPKVGSEFTRRVDESWLEDEIVRRELLEVEGIVKFNGLSLTKSSGKRIPVDWISQGSKQFIMMTQNPSYVVNCVHVGWNVYKYFKEWADTKYVDVTLLMNGNGALHVEGLSGLFLNSGEIFSSSRELVNMIYEHDMDDLLLKHGSTNSVICSHNKDGNTFSRVIELF